MGFSQSVRTCLSKYADFSGRASRSEYWWFILFVFVASIAFSLLDAMLFGTNDRGETRSVLAGIFQLAVLLPLLAAGWRRMHDTGRPGWYLLAPALFALAIVAFLFGGAYLLGSTPQTGFAGGLAVFGRIGIGLAAIAQFVLSVLLIWWLASAPEKFLNAYGPPPTA